MGTDSIKGGGVGSVVVAKGDQASGDTENGAELRMPGAAVANGLVTDTIFLVVKVRVTKVAAKRSARGQVNVDNAREPIQSWTSRMRNKEPCSVRGAPRYSPGRSKKKKPYTKHWAAALVTGVFSAVVRIQT